MKTHTPRFTNIAEIKKANKEAGRFWFSPATVKMFKPIVETRIYDAGTSADHPQGSRLWVESTRNYDDSGREFKVVRFDVAGGDISYVSVDYRTLVFTNKADAVKALEAML